MAWLFFRCSEYSDDSELIHEPIFSAVLDNEALNHGKLAEKPLHSTSEGTDTRHRGLRIVTDCEMLLGRDSEELPANERKRGPERSGINRRR